MVWCAQNKIYGMVLLVQVIMLLSIARSYKQLVVAITKDKHTQAVQMGRYLVIQIGLNSLTQVMGQLELKLVLTMELKALLVNKCTHGVIYRLLTMVILTKNYISVMVMVMILTGNLV